MRTAVSALVREGAVLILVLACASIALAQYSGNVQGVISDPTGAAINGATVTLRDTDTAVTLTTTSSDSGNYRFSSLPPGPYVISAEANNFQKKEINVALGTSETKGVNVTLPVGTASQSVTVSTEAPAVDTDDSRIQSTLSADTVRDLPVLNRNIYDVLSVAPGVVGTGTRGPGESPGGGADNFGTQTPQISANGRSYTGNRVIVDGMDATSNIQNGNIIFAPPPDAVQEVSLQTNSFDAENNLGSSVLVQITTKSGTNKFHGTGSYFFTNQDLSAKGEFAGKAPLNPYSRHDITGTFGGPVVKDKTFFFADFELLRSSTSTGNSTLSFEAPEFVTWAQSNFPNSIGTGLFATYPLSGITGATLKSTASQYFGAANCGTAATFNIPCSLPVLDSGNFNASPPYNGLLYNFRVDQYLGTKDRIYGSYANDSFTQHSLAPRKGLSVENIMGNWYVQGNWTHTFSPHLLNEASFAANKVAGTNGTGGDFRVPQVNVTGQDIGFTGGGWGPGTFEGRNYNWREVLTSIHGAHTLKAGFNGTHAIEDGDFSPVNNRPTFQFTDLLQLVQDQPFSEGGVAYNPLSGTATKVIFGGQTTPYGVFFQDDWKVRSNLSLTLALRWDNFGNHTPWGNSGFTFGNLLLPSGASFADQVTNASVRTVKGVFANSMTNLWSPRIGFAWDPSKRGTWSVRGGIGVYHDWITLGQSVDLMRNNPPGVATPSFSQQTTIKPVFALSTSGAPPYDFPLPPIPAGSLDQHGGLVGAQLGVTSLARNLNSPYAVNYTFGVEHQLAWKLVAGGNYAGSRGYDQLTGTDVNRFPSGVTVVNGTDPTFGDPTVNTSLARLNASFGGIDYIHNGNSSTYNAMILFLRRAASSWGSFQGSYTLSHAKANIESGTRFDQDGGLNIPDQNAYNSYMGDANWDVRQRFSFSGTYTVPRMKNGWASVLTSGWEVTTVAAIQTGTPFWVIDTRPFDALCNYTPPGGSVQTGGCNGFKATQANLIASGTDGGSLSLVPGALQFATDSGDYNLDGLGYDIPNAPTTNFSGSHSRKDYIKGLFTAADFTQPTIGSEGSLRRNTYRNPGMLQLDASVIKNTRLPWLGEQGSLQFRFDFLNLLNRVNLGTVDAGLSDGNFGKSTSTLPARQIQLGARISF